jgi:hypothetical protein
MSFEQFIQGASYASGEGCERLTVRIHKPGWIVEDLRD